jgi:uncharacterized protein
MKLVFKLTSKCNFRCSYCYLYNSEAEGKVEKNTSSSISLETCIDAFEKAVVAYPDETIEVTFFGGEPLVNWKVMTQWFEWLSQHPERYRASHSINTNGGLLTQERIEVLAANNTYINLSLDDINIRPQIMKTIKSITDLDPFSLAVRLNVSKPERDLVADYKELLSLGARNIHIVPLSDLNYDYQMFIESYANLIDFARTEIAGGSLANAQLKFVMRNLISNNLKEKFCGIGANYVAVNTDGDIYPCTGFLDVKGFKQGSLRDDGFDKALESLAAFETKATLQNRPGCGTCFMQYICAGNCSHANYLYFGEISKTFENECMWMRYLGSEAMSLLIDAKKEVGEKGLEKILFNPDLIWLKRAKLRKGAHVRDGKYAYYPSQSGHRLIELDSVHTKLLDLARHGIGLSELFGQLMLEGVGLEQEVFLNIVNGFVENGLVELYG